MARRFGEMLDGALAFLNKTRPTHDEASVTEVIGHVEGKVAIMSDDMIVTGGTLLAGARALHEAGATQVYACATHGLFPSGTLDKLAASELVEVVVTNTVWINPLETPDKVTVLTVSGILAQSIMNVFQDESVSAIFAGENQLF
jgi:ribose-phosphate pyrophosphokinase